MRFGEHARMNSPTKQHISIYALQQSNVALCLIMALDAGCSLTCHVACRRVDSYCPGGRIRRAGGDISLG